MFVTFYLYFSSQSLTATGLTATENSDFVFNDQTVQFQPGDTQQTRQVLIDNDNAVESTEFFSVTLTSTDGNVETQDPTSTVVSIIDNDGTVNFVIFCAADILSANF